MSVARRRLLQSLALAGGFGSAGEAQQPKLEIAVLRDAATVHGINLSDARLRVIRPALEHHLSELRPLRRLEIQDSVGPTQGILPE